MGKREMKLVLGGLLVFTLLLCLGSADVKYNSDNLKNNYNTGDTITGTININVTNEAADGKFTASGFGGGISLIDLINANNLSSGYSCSISGCGSDYSTVGDVINALDFAGNSKAVAFKLSGNSVTISSLYIKLLSNADQSCTQPLSVDILGDGTRLKQSNLYSIPCGIRNYGCFSANDSGAQALIGTGNYCENVNMPAAPAYEIGAKITWSGSGNVTMRLMSEDGGSELGSCKIPAGSGEQEVNCIANYSSADTRTFRVCLTAGAVTNHKISVETSGSVCGTDGSSSKDFEIFARPLSFAPSPTIEINSTKDSGVVNEINNYIQNRYGGNCPSNGCIIPIKISGTPQEISLVGAKIRYKGGSTDYESSGVYNTEESVSTITGNNLNLEIGPANFVVQSDVISQNFLLKYNGNRLLNESIRLTSLFDFDITPRFAPTGISTLFSITTFGLNITSATWNFGDGSMVQTAYGKTAAHTYTRDGEYEATVDATNNFGEKSTMKFMVLSGEAASSARILISRYEKRISDVNTQMAGYQSWIGVGEALNLSLIAATVAQAKSDLNTNVSNSSAAGVIQTLASLNVPYAVKTSSSESYPLATGYAGIDSSLAGTFEGKTINDPEGTNRAIINWMDANYDGRIRIDKVTAYYDSGSTFVTNYYVLTVTPKGSVQDATVFINYPVNAIKFKESYGQVDAGSGTAIPINGAKTIEFAITQDIGAANLGIYLAPSLDSLVPISTTPITPAVGPHFVFSWGLFIIGLVVLIILFFVVFIVIQEWNKKNKENGLFPNSDDLYNVITFIHNSRKKGMADGEIREKLAKSGWRKEQINYAFNKLEGKSEGFEIPLFRASEQKKVQEEIAKRQGNVATGQQKTPGARFIKR